MRLPVEKDLLLPVLLLSLLNVFPARMADSLPTSGLMEGDLAVPGQRTTGVLSSFVEAEANLWTNGLVPYKFDKMKLAGGGFDPLFTDQNMELVRSVLQEIMEAVPCIEFREVSDDDPSQCLIFTVMGDSERPAQGCWSFVGYVGAQGGKTGQALNLGQNCFKKEIVLHEVLHALGATHEQNRQDRDLYLTVHFDNIQEAARVNFEKKTDNFDSRGTPYDYMSIMHYKAKDFSKNSKATITPIQRNITLRHREEMSAIDIIELAKVYENVTARSCFSSRRLLDYVAELEALKYTGSCRAAMELHKSQNELIEAKQIAFDSLGNVMKSQEAARVDQRKAVQMCEKTRADQSIVIADLRHDMQAIRTCEREMNLTESLQDLVEQQKTVIADKTDLDNTIVKQGEVISKQSEVISSLLARLGAQPEDKEPEAMAPSDKRCWEGTLMEDSPLAACVQDEEGQDWVLIQQRGQFGNGQDYFAKTFAEYQEGFTSHKELWLGLDNMAELTTYDTWELWIELTTWGGNIYPSKKLHAFYKNFKVGQGPGYKLTVNSPDTTRSTLGTQSINHSNGKKFSAIDLDQDTRTTGNCSTYQGGNGGWWSGNCHHCNLNGNNYEKPTENSGGITWYHNGDSMPNSYYSFQESKMAIRKKL